MSYISNIPYINDMTVPLGPIVYGKDFNFFEKVDVSVLDFNTDADAIIRFSINHVSLYNEGTGIVEVSFNGSTVHCELNPQIGTHNVTIHNAGINKIWLRLKAGNTSTVRIQSNTIVENNISPTGGVSVQLSNASASGDAFGRFRTADPFTLFESKQLIDNRSIAWSTQLDTGGTSTFDANRASSLLEVTSTIGSSVTRQTKIRFNYQAGKSLLILNTMVMGDTPSGIIKEVGYGDENNGLFLRNNGGVLSLVIRSYVGGMVSENEILQSDWNLDSLDGTGASQVTLDITKANIFLFDIEWLGVGRVRFGFNIDGTTYYVHQALHANVVSSVYMSTPNLPIRYYITNDSSGSTSSLEQICSSVISEGGYESKGYQFSIDRGVSVLASVDNAALYPLVSLRLDTTKKSASIIPEGIHVICTTNNASFKWALVLNPTIGGTDAASWQNVTNSAAQYDISRTLTNVITGGTVIHSGYGSAGSAALDVSIDLYHRLGVNLSNVSDEIVLCVQKIAASTDSFLGAISWKEII